MINQRHLTAVTAATLSLAAAVVAVVPAPAAHASAGSTLTVQVGNVKNDRGHIHVDICTASQFLHDCPYSGEAPAKVGVTTVTVPNLPAGVYAAQVFHDENDTHSVDRNLFGIPKEGVGFSNDPRIRVSAPKFSAASFAYDGQAGAISLNLQYFAR